MGDVSKLPIWAQAKIRFLEQEIASVKDEMALRADIHPCSNVRLSGFGTRPDQTLPPDSNIDFYLGESREKYRKMVTVRHMRSRPDTLYVQSAGGHLLVHPVASNVVEIRLEDH